MGQVHEKVVLKYTITMTQLPYSGEPCVMMDSRTQRQELFATIWDTGRSWNGLFQRVFNVKEQNLLHHHSTTAISIVCQVITVEIPFIVTLSLSVFIVQKKEEEIFDAILSSPNARASHFSSFSVSEINCNPRLNS